MRYTILAVASMLLVGCATETATEAPYDPLEDYEEVDPTTVLDVPGAQPGNYAPEHLYQVKRGEYLVELLGCGACHTEGALQGVPDFDKSLAGSTIGIAFENPMGMERPGIVYPPNITPDEGNRYRCLERHPDQPGYSSRAWPPCRPSYRSHALAGLCQDR